MNERINAIDKVIFSNEDITSHLLTNYENKIALKLKNILYCRLDGQEHSKVEVEAQRIINWAIHDYYFNWKYNNQEGFAVDDSCIDQLINYSILDVTELEMLLAVLSAFSRRKILVGNPLNLSAYVLLAWFAVVELKKGSDMVLTMMATHEAILIEHYDFLPTWEKMVEKGTKYSEDRRKKIKKRRTAKIKSVLATDKQHEKHRERKDVALSFYRKSDYSKQKGMKNQAATFISKQMGIPYNTVRRWLTAIG